MTCYFHLKCLNFHHLDDAEEILKHPVIDNYTMNAEHDDMKQIVSLECPWCGYNTKVDVSDRAVELEVRGVKTGKSTFKRAFFTVG